MELVLVVAPACGSCRSKLSTPGTRQRVRTGRPGSTPRLVPREPSLIPGSRPQNDTSSALRPRTSAGVCAGHGRLDRAKCSGASGRSGSGGRCLPGCHRGLLRRGYGRIRRRGDPAVRECSPARRLRCGNGRAVRLSPGPIDGQEHQGVVPRAGPPGEGRSRWGAEGVRHHRGPPGSSWQCARRAVRA